MTTVNLLITRLLKARIPRRKIIFIVKTTLKQIQESVNAGFFILSEVFLCMIYKILLSMIVMCNIIR